MVTLDAWLTSWIDGRSIRLAESTITGYRLLQAKYITPFPIGSIPIEEIKPQDLICMLTIPIRDGHTRAAQLLQIMVSASIRAAVRQRILDWNPMDAIDRVKHYPRETAWLTEEQSSRLIAAAKPPYNLAYLLAICCGLRRGELLGLMWSDVDFDRAELHIRRQKIHVNGQNIVRQPKSRTSIRTIPLADEVKTCLLTARGRADSLYVVPVTAKMLMRELETTLKAEKLPRVTLHGLRHSMAAAAATEGIPIRTLQALMGHAHYSTTADVYAHVDLTAIVSAARMVAAHILREHDWKSCNG